MPNKNPTVKEIVKEYLEKNGYDGLFNTEYEAEEGVCFCLLENLMGCGESLDDCRAGRKTIIDSDEVIYWEPEKEGQDDSYKG